MAIKIWVGTDSGNEGDWATAANWSPSGVPSASDEVYLQDSSQAVTDGLDQSAIALTSLNIAQSYTGAIGTSAGYLLVDPDVFNYGYNYGVGSPTGSQSAYINLGSNTVAATVFNTASAGTTTTDVPLHLKADNASTTLTIKKGKVQLVTESGESPSMATLNVQYDTAPSSDADVYIDDGWTIATMNQIGGDVVSQSVFTTARISAGTLKVYSASGDTVTLLQIDGGTVTFNGAGAITTVTTTGGILYKYGAGAVTTATHTDGIIYTYDSGTVGTWNQRGGTAYPSSSGTITAYNLYSGTADFTRSNTARTVTTMKVDPTSIFKYYIDTLTLTNAIQPVSAAGMITYTAA